MNKHDISTLVTPTGYYTAFCACGWSDFPRLTWSLAQRDATYHLHSIGQHRYQCHYCRDIELGIAHEQTCRNIDCGTCYEATGVGLY